MIEKMVKTDYLRKSLVREIFFVWFIFSLLASPALAQPKAFVEDRSFRTLEASGAYFKSIFSENPSGAPKRAFERESFVRGLLDRNLFSGRDNLSSDSKNRAPEFFYSYSKPDILNLPNNDRAEMSVTKRTIKETAARDTAYQMASEILFSIEPVARLRNAIEPYTRLLEIYRDKDGAISPNYLGQKNIHSTGDVRVLVVNLGISSSHNLNVMANIYDRFAVSFLDGSILTLSYMLPESNDKIGFETNARSETLLKYSMEF